MSEGRSVDRHSVTQKRLVNDVFTIVSAYINCLTAGHRSRGTGRITWSSYVHHRHANKSVASMNFLTLSSNTNWGKLDRRIVYPRLKYTARRNEWRHISQSLSSFHMTLSVLGLLDTVHGNTHMDMDMDTKHILSTCHYYYYYCHHHSLGLPL